MNRKRIGAALLVIAAMSPGAPAQAEVVRVQTGEHARFTRVAMVLDAPTGWRAGRTPKGYAVAFERENLTLSLEGAFRLIPRDRIANLAWDAQARRLLIDSTCDCHLDVFEMPGNTLVIDVKSGAAPQSAGFEAMIDRPEPVEQAEETARLPLPMIFNQSPPALLFDADPRPDTHDVSAMESRLVSALGRAASEGFLNLELPATPVQESRPGDGVLSDRASELLDHIESRSASGQPETPEMAAQRALLASCPEPSEVDVGNWGRETLASTYTSGRDTLFDDLGRVDESAVLARVRSLLHLGFGAEAINHLGLLERRSREIDILTDLALIMDQVPERTPRVLGTAYRCPSAAALWSLISGADPALMPEVDAAAVQRAFVTLPAHVQRLIGTDTVRALRKADAPEQALAVLNAMERLPGPPNAALMALRGEDRLANGDTTGGEAALGSVIHEDSAGSPEAILTLLRAREARGATVPEDMLLLAESVAQELRGAVISDDLLDAAARAHARDGRFEKAFSLLEGLMGRSQDQNADLRSDLAAKLAAKAPDNAFLLLAFGQGLMLPKAALSDDATLALAERLLDLGFAVEADGLTASVARTAPEVTLLRGEIALARGFPDLALEHVADLDGTDAAALRARARAATGASAEAAGLFGEIGARDSAAAEAWASGDDTLIATHGGDGEREFIESVSRGPMGLPLPQQAALAIEQISQQNLRSLLDGTATFRSAAETLLEQQRIGNE